MPRGKKRIDTRNYGEMQGRPSNATRDCTVRALHIASDMDYDLCLITLAVCGRRKNSGVRFRDWYPAFAKLNLCFPMNRIKDVKSVLDPRIQNNCVVLIPGHVYAIKNGIHSDGQHASANIRCRVRMAWRIE